MTEWISVKDRLPEVSSQVHGPEDPVSGGVLIYNADYGILLAWCELWPFPYPDAPKYMWFTARVNDNYLIPEPTHWMPPPEPPEE